MIALCHAVLGTVGYSFVLDISLCAQWYEPYGCGLAMSRLAKHPRELDKKRSHTVRYTDRQSGRLSLIALLFVKTYKGLMKILSQCCYRLVHIRDQEMKPLH